MNLLSGPRFSAYYRVFFLKKIYKNFVGTLESAPNIEVSVPRGSTVFALLLYFIVRTSEPG